MRIFKHEKHPGVRFVLYEEFELLEEHVPPWYLRRHYNAIKRALGGGENDG